MKPDIKLVASYSIDWIVTAGLWGVFYGVRIILAVGKIDGFKRTFNLTDTSLQHSHTESSTVPSWVNYVLGLVAPAVIILLTNAIRYRSWWDIHSGFLGAALSFSLAASITNIVKVTVGRPRPDIIARCQPTQASIDAAVGLVSSQICTVVDSDGWRSFPSGHSSNSMAGCSFISLYLAGKLNVLDQRGHTYKGFLVVCPLLVGALVGLSRLADYHHHPVDVLVGLWLGIAASYFSFHNYYHPLTSSMPGVPFPPRNLSAIRLRPRLEEDEHNLVQGPSREFF